MFFFILKENMDYTYHRGLCMNENKNLTKNRITLFLIGLFGLQLISFFIASSGLLQQFVDSFKIVTSNELLAYLNFLCYALTIIPALFIFDKEQLHKLTEGLKDKTKIKQGVILWVVLTSSSIIYNVITSIAFGSGDNQNQTSVNDSILASPFLMSLIVAILGPLIEEITYRYGLFGSIKKKSRILAYLLTMVIFGFIHFDFSAIFTDQNALINELINIPSYIISGAILCFGYDRDETMAVPTIAHILNNASSVLGILILSFLL